MDGKESAYSHVLLPTRLKHSHSGQRAGSHGDIGQFVGRAVRMNTIQIRAFSVNPSQHKCSADMSLISIQSKKRLFIISYENVFQQKPVLKLKSVFQQ